MGKRGADSTSHASSKLKHGKRYNDLVHDDISHMMHAGRVTKSGVHYILQYLHDHDFLKEQLGRDRITRAVANHAAVSTPYGDVVQPFHVGIEERVECCDPAALLYYMCSISHTFADLCKHTVMAAGDNALRYVAYNDTVIPGNPFRPEKGRKVESFYWVIVDWPSYLIHRSGMWPVFSLIRCRLVDTIPGGVSHTSTQRIRSCSALTETRDCACSRYVSSWITHCSESSGGVHRQAHAA